MSAKLQKNYRIGIDVGLNSIGFCCVEVDENDSPVEFLNLAVYRHDAGIDPNGKKTNTTRLAMSGVARRTRRLFQKRRKRLKKLDDFLKAEGYPLPDNEDYSDPYQPWLVRAELAQTLVVDEFERKEKLALALRHMARHRGWRSPWVPVRSLHVPQEHSDQYLALRKRVEEKTLLVMPDDATPAEMIVSLGLSTSVKLRGENGILGGKLMQSDNANELRKIAMVQGIDEKTLNLIIDRVFESHLPEEASEKLVGKDVLPGQTGQRRALKADPAFQRYRIASIISNLRIKNPSTGDVERFEPETQRRVFDFLIDAKPNTEITWSDVAEHLGVERNLLMGTASLTADGERASALPPRDVTELTFAACKVASIKAWWKEADYEGKRELVLALSNATKLDEDSVAKSEVMELLQSLTDEDFEKLDAFSLPIGRAAYSVDSLERLTNRMLQYGEDLFEARLNEFGVSPDWRPPAEEIGASVGNPAVDRVLKAVNRYLLSAEAQWGAPLSVNIEHVRDGFMSKKQAADLDRENQKRFSRNQAIRQQISGMDASPVGVRQSEITRYLAIQRQNGQCLYCGNPITFTDSQMDHIVPRAGRGSTNTRDNLVATCERCNSAKSNTPFAVWAANCGIPGVSVKEALERVKFWNADPHASSRELKQLQKAVSDRLKRKVEDPEIDDRSMESVAWMARELQHRVDYYFKQKQSDTKVRVFRGSLTSAARKASGFENRVNFIGGNGKTRLDRRHHAMDAAVVAMLRASVAKTLVLRGNIMASERATGAPETWKTFRGESHADEVLFDRWSENMLKLVEKFNLALTEDKVHVFQSLRLQLGNGRAHDETVSKLKKHRVGDAWSLTEIDRASTPALWCALTREPDFDWETGLPENPNRKIRVNGTHYSAGDFVGVFDKAAASMLVRGGSVDIGGAIHHARIYRISGKKPSYGMVRVFAFDLQRHKNEDLFSVELPPQSVSLRYADPKVRKAIREGTAEYLGWIVIGDELELDLSNETSGQIGELLKDFPGTNRWTVAGFFSPVTLRLRPIYLAAEGHADVVNAGSKSIVSGQGWLPAVNKVFSGELVKIIRRRSDGTSRNDSDSNLPVSWSVRN